MKSHRSNAGEPPIATRRLIRRGTRSGFATVKLWAPRERRKGEWSCRFFVTAVGMKDSKEVYGADAIQALQNAMLGIRIVLDKGGRSLTWAGRPARYTFPRTVEWVFGARLTRKLETVLARESQRFLDARRDIGARARMKDASQQARQPVGAEKSRRRISASDRRTR